MPIYEYHCNACNADFEKLVSGTEPEVVCEKCGSKKTAKRLSRFSMSVGSSGIDFSESFTTDLDGNVTSRGSGSDSSSSGSDCGSCTASSCEGCK